MGKEKWAVIEAASYLYPFSHPPAVSWRFVGNERAAAAVQRALASGSPPHAWLFVGPEHVGKATLARMVAQALNCEAPVGDRPCGECGQCRRIASGIHSDVQTIAIELDDDGRRRKEISVDQLREVERAVALKAYEGRTRVVIIDPADDMSAAAQNAFLKTLEEPPPDVVFLLVATQEERLLPTVRSRCRRVEFRLAQTAVIEQALLSGSKDPDLHPVGVDAERAALLARLARGRAGWALAAAKDPSLLEKRREALEQASALGGMPLADRFDLAERLSAQFRNDRDDVFQRLEEWQSWWRDVLLIQSGAEDGIGNADMISELRADARRYDQRQVRAFVRALTACRESLAVNVQSRIALDALMAEAPRLERVQLRRV